MSDWQDMSTAPKDGTGILLGRIEDFDGGFYVRHGFYEGGRNDRCWYDIDGEKIEPQVWMPLPSPPPSALTATPGEGARE